MRRAVYIGRFQVLHLGHLDVLKFIDAQPDVDEIAVVIGSTQYDHRTKHPDAPWAVNPFSVDERRALVEAALSGQLGKPWRVHCVPDTHDCATWIAGVLAATGPVHVLFSATRKERELFMAHGVEARTFPRGRPFHAGTIRERMAAGEAWADAVPPAAAAVLRGLGCEARLRELVARDQATLVGEAP